MDCNRRARADVAGFPKGGRSKGQGVRTKRTHGMNAVWTVCKSGGRTNQRSNFVWRVACGARDFNDCVDSNSFVAQAILHQPRFGCIYLRLL